MTAVVVSLPGSSLSCLDRCDRCGAQAYVAVDNPSLLFCAHHYAENADALNLAGAVVAVDCRDELSPPPSGLCQCPPPWRFDSDGCSCANCGRALPDEAF